MCLGSEAERPAAGMSERFDVYRGGECVLRGASLRQAAELLNIETIDLERFLRIVIPL